MQDWSIQWYSRLTDIRTDPGKTTLRFNSTGVFLNLCETRQSCRIALVDSQGNLLQLSEEYHFQSGKQSYLVSPIIYNLETMDCQPKIGQKLFSRMESFELNGRKISKRTVNARVIKPMNIISEFRF